jgi:protein-disulfide isomerase
LGLEWQIHIQKCNCEFRLVEFLDPECEACAALHPLIKRLLVTYEGKIQLVIRYFPLHSNSLLASRVTEAAGAQGKYWEMQDLLFTRRSEWAEQVTPQTEHFLGYAEGLGLDMVRFNTDLNNHVFTQMVIRDSQDGVKLVLAQIRCKGKKK